MLRGARELPGRGHRGRRLRRLTPLLLPLLLACGKGDDSDSASAVSSSDLYTSDGLFHVLSFTNPDPPTTGAAALYLTITHAADESPVSNAATVSAAVSLPSEGLTVSPDPMVGLTGDGGFVASWAYPHAGLYQVALHISDETGDDSTTLTYSVQ